MSRGVISLLNDHSIDCVVDPKGRVPLAHLIEFSHFVDLYVLEEKIFVDSVTKKQILDPHFNSDKNSPLIELPDGDLSDALFLVNDHSREIYDAAPINHTFSFGSYDYWTRLNEKECVNAPGHVERPGNRYTREDLLLASKGLAEQIGEVLEEVSSTTFTVMPSSLNLIPFLHAFHQMNTPALFLYKNITSVHRQLVEELLEVIRPRTVYLPPLLLILLSRCNNKTDIPLRLAELRGEYSGLRKSVNSWFSRLDEAPTLREKIEVRSELDESLRAATEGLQSRRRGIYKEVAFSLFDALAEGDIKKALVKPSVTLFKRSVDKLAPELLAARRFTGLVNLLDEALDIQNYQTILTRVFGESLDISQREITEAKKYRRYLIRQHEHDWPLPT